MHATAPHPVHVRTAVLFGILLCAGFAACADSVHLDPSGAGAGGASAGSTTSTGDAASGCRSNADCPFPTAVCDTVTGTCVGCLTSSDCSYAPGSVCNGGQCSCAGDACDAGTGGAGGKDAGDDGGSDGGLHDGGSDAAAACVPTCVKALTTGGTVCPGTLGDLYYDQVRACAGCGAPGPCTLTCTSFCLEHGIDALCEQCLMTDCAPPFMDCETH